MMNALMNRMEIRSASTAAPGAALETAREGHSPGTMRAGQSQGEQGEST